MTIAEDCIALITKKLAKEIGPEEFYSEVMLLDRKYPNAGFRSAAELYANNLRKHQKKEKKPVRDGKAAASGEETELPF